MDYKEKASVWRVLATEDVEEDLSEFVRYLLYEKLSEQAADAVLQDYDTGWSKFVWVDSYNCDLFGWCS
jgi:hypothetical protein